MDASTTEEIPSKEGRKFIFKDGNFSVSSVLNRLIWYYKLRLSTVLFFSVPQYYINVSNKKKIWKSLKQIISYERNLPWPKDTVHCKCSFTYYIITVNLPTF